MSDGDYVLGTQDDEVDRLGLQHRIWRGRVLEAFHSAPIHAGMKVIDAGAGPGFVSADLAEIVGASGKVIALERSPHFANTLRRRNLPNVEVREHDVLQPFGIDNADASWCRWLLCFLADPGAAVANIANALKSGGVAIFHEYAAYNTWRCMPPDPLHERFRALVEQSWRDSGGEPDAALWLPKWLDAAGLEIVGSRILCDVITPEEAAWEWPRSFMAVNAQRLHALGYLAETEVETMAGLLDDPKPGARMLTPVVAEIIARKP